MNFTAAAGLLGCLLLLARGGSAAAAVPDENANPYSVISERNVFHLNPIPPPAPPAETPKADLPEIKLSGFLKIGKSTHALFSSRPKDKKEAPIYYDLVDGEKEGILEVVKIHEDKGEVEIVNSGTPVTLSLKNDAIKESPLAKGAEADAGRPHDHRSTFEPEHMPGRSAYRFPVPGQTGGSVQPGFPMPARQPRVQQ
jgi:hypothetical protein